MRIDEITIGARHRRDAIAEKAASECALSHLGPLPPIVVEVGASTRPSCSWKAAAPEAAFQRPGGMGGWNAPRSRGENHCQETREGTWTLQTC